MARPSATALSIAGVTVLYGLVAATAHTSVWAPAREGTAPLIRLVGMVAGVACVAVAVVGVIWILRGAGGGTGRSWRETLHRAWPAATVGVVLVSLVAIAQTDLAQYQGPRVQVPSVDLPPGREGVRLRMDWGGSATRQAGEAEPGEGAALDRPDAPALVLVFLLIVGVIGLVAVATTWWSTRRRVRLPTPTLNVDRRREAARGAILATIDAMLADPDPRTAIIGAYARLQTELSTRGAARKDYEGPKEHLHRVLSVLDIPSEPLERLIGLFEEARFSTHTLTASDRDRALGALRQVASNLAAPVESSSTSGVA